MNRDQDPDLCRKLADKLIEMGWRATCDAQHDNLRNSIHELRQLLVPVQVDFMRAQFAGQAMHLRSRRYLGPCRRTHRGKKLRSGGLDAPRSCSEGQAMNPSPTPREIAEMTKRQGKTWAENNGGKTGAPPGLLQDDCRKLSRALANAPHARQHVREVCAAINHPSQRTGDKHDSC